MAHALPIIHLPLSDDWTTTPECERARSPTQLEYYDSAFQSAHTTAESEIATGLGESSHAGSDGRKLPQIGHDKHQSV